MVYIFITSFPLLILDLTCSTFFSFLRWKFIYFNLYFFWYMYLMLKILLYPTNFDKLYFHFHLDTFLNISLGVSALTLGLFSNILWLSTIFLLLMNSLVLVWFESILCMICILLPWWGHILGPIMQSVLVKASWTWEHCFCCCWVEYSKMSIRSSWLIVI